jgi:hypothetical protein
MLFKSFNESINITNSSTRVTIHYNYLLDKKIKFTYRNDNSFEECNTYLFDGHKWNIIVTLFDIDIEERTMYVNDKNIKEKRYLSLLEKTKKLIIHLFD